VVLAPGLVILVFVSSQTGFSVHSRYVIPALPFLFVWMSKIGRMFEARPFHRKRLALAAMVVIAFSWSVISSLSIYPHSLSYFNELAAILPAPADATYPKPICERREDQSLLSRVGCVLTAGPRNGARHLLDSNIDWGQNLLYLKNWLTDHPEVKLDGLAYWGSYSAALAGIPEVPDPPPGPESDYHESRTPQEELGPREGWYALSVNYLYDRTRRYRYFLNFEPVAMVGYSIHIYHVKHDEAIQVRRELGLQPSSHTYIR
jgi:hypothetical protein